jgi:hypothetical protein
MAIENSSTLAATAEERAGLEFRPPYEGVYSDVVNVQSHWMERVATAVAGISGVLELLNASVIGEDLGDHPWLTSNQRAGLICAGLGSASVLQDFVEWHQAHEVEARAKEAAHG